MSLAANFRLQRQRIRLASAVVVQSMVLLYVRTAISDRVECCEWILQNS